MVYVIYIAAGIILLGLCIFVHELGHLLGGKMVGIMAKTFSIGYGKGIIKKKIGVTTYQLAPIPFGGYCQFYGEDPAEERTGQQYEFLSAHPARRIVTVAMGPLFNLIFGIIIFFAMNLVGYSKDTNRVHIPEYMRSGATASPAAAAGIVSGDRIVKIGAKEIQSFPDIVSTVLFSDGKKLDVTVMRGGKPERFTVTPRRQESGRYEIGVAPYGSRVLIVEVMEGGAAMEAGIREMDEIAALDGNAVSDETAFTRYIQGHADRPVEFKIVRKGSSFIKSITPRRSDIIKFQTVDAKGNKGELIPIVNSKNLQRILSKGQIAVNGKTMTTYDALKEAIRSGRDRSITLRIDREKYSGRGLIEQVGLIGVMPTVSPDQVHVQYGFGGALVQAFVEPYDFIVLNLKGMGMLFSGKMNVRENLSGPIRIAKIAGDVAYYKGMADWILLMAKISIILMVMNLLPIPVVDGSHILFFAVEWIRRKPLSQKVMERIQTVGIVILVMLGVFIILNDISMLPVIQRLFNK